MNRGRKPDQWAFQAGHVFSPERAAQLVDLYDAEIRYTDEQIGRVLDELRRQRLLDRSVVIFTADHGERLGEGYWWDHCASLHGREIDVPMWVQVRGAPLTGRSVESAVSTLDIVPTVLSLLGISYGPNEVDGLRLMDTPEDRRIVTVWQNQRTIQDHKWKLYEGSDGTVRLFRIDRDPSEENDLVASETEVKLNMLEDLRGRAASDAELKRASEDVVKKLRAVGYIQ
jgi:arylsulfatase A-like enzyme